MAGVSLIFGGDIGALRSDGRGMFGDATNTIAAADLAVANLEFALSERDEPTRGKIYPHRAPPGALAGLVEAGFDALNLANNHMLDFRAAALVDTMALLDGAGIARFGAGRDAQEAARPAVVERGGLRIGLLGYSSTLPTGFAAGAGVAGINALRALTSYRQFRNPDEYPGSAPIVETRPVGEDLARMVGDIRRLKRRADVVLVYQHWGESMNEKVHDFQRAIGQAAIDAGAAGVFGGHSHVIQAVEFYRGRPIVHGLGNLVFDFVAPFFTPATRRTILFGASVTGDGLGDCHAWCCRTGVDGPVAMLHPSGGEGREIVDTVTRLSTPFGTAVAADGRRVTLRPSGA